MLQLWPDFYDIWYLALLHQHPPTKTKGFCQFLSAMTRRSKSILRHLPWWSGTGRREIFCGFIWEEALWYTYWNHSGSSSESLELGIIWIVSLLIQLGFKSHGKVWKQWISPLKGVILRPKRFRLLAETSRRKEIWKKKLFLEEI